MSEKRINTVTIIIGGRGTGKTTFSQELMKDHPKKVLIVDTFNHPSYKHVPRIHPHQLKKWEKGIYRIWPLKDSYTIEEILASIDSDLNNCMIFFEDALKYISGKLKPEERRFIIDSKQKNLDMLFLYHSYGQVPPDLYRFCDFVTVFKTNDNPTTRKNQIPVYDQIVHAYHDVMADPSKYANRTIRTN